MPRLLNPDEKARFGELQAYFNVSSTASRLDEFAKWIFTAITLITTVSTGAAAFTFQTLKPQSKIFFGISFVFQGLSLAFAVMILMPKFPRIWLGSLDDLNQKFSAVIKSRRNSTICAAISLALSFLFAGLTPILSAHSDQVKPAGAFSYSSNGKKFIIQRQATGLQAGSRARLKVSKSSTDKTILYLSEADIGADGVANITANVEAIPLTPLTVEFSAIDTAGKLFNDNQTITPIPTP